MASIRQAILAVARNLGYDGNAPRSIAGAITALGSVMGGGTSGGSGDGSGGGTSGGGLMCNITFDAEKNVFVLDKTAQEIVTAISSGAAVYAAIEADFNEVNVLALVGADYDETSTDATFFTFTFASASHVETFEATLPTDYPTEEFGGGGGDAGTVVV